MYLTACLIAPGGAQLPTVAHSRSVSHSQKLEGGSHVSHDWRYASYLHLQSSGLFLFLTEVGRSVREKKTSMLRETFFYKSAWQLLDFVAVIMTYKGKAFMLLLIFYLFICITWATKHHLLQWTPARVWIGALWLRRSPTHMKTATSRPTKDLSHFYFLFLIFIHLYLHQVKYSSESPSI